MNIFKIFKMAIDNYGVSAKTNDELNQWFNNLEIKQKLEIFVEFKLKKK